MTSKTIMIGLVAIAFVAGSIVTGSMAYASGDKNGKPFEALWDAIHVLETAIADTSTTDDLQSQIDTIDNPNIFSVHTEQPASVNAIFGTQIMQQTFDTTSDSATIFITGDVRFTAKTGFLYAELLVDGDNVVTSIDQTSGNSVVNVDNVFSWTGTVPSGAHNVEVKVGSISGVTTICGVPTQTELCQINTLIID